MNAHSPIPAATECVPLQAVATRGDAFRGRFLDRCAIIEEWAVTVLKNTGQKKQSTYLFGQKLQSVRTLAQTEPALFKAPKRVLALLDALQPFIELRTHLAHSVQTVVRSGDGTDLVIFKPIHGAAPVWLGAVLDQTEMDHLLREVGRLAKELGDQRLKEVTPPSPPPPKPAATAGP